MRKVIKTKKITWIDVESPTEKDIKYLEKNFTLHPIVLEELSVSSHRSRIENYKNYLFMIFHVPFLDKEKREIKPRELDIVVTKTHVITVHHKSILPLKALFDQCNLYEEAKRNYMNESTGHLFYYVIHGILEYVSPKLEFIEDGIDHVEEEMFRGKERKMVTEISLLRRVIIDFRRIIEPQKSFFDSLLTEGVEFFGSKLEPYLYDLSGSYSSIWNLLETHKETIEALENTNQSLLTTKTNDVIRVLTIFASIALPLTFITGIFGMNTSLPLVGKGAETDFWNIVVIMAVTAIVLIVFFKKQKWL